MLRIEVPVGQADVVADALWAAGASAVGEESRGGVVVLTSDLEGCPPTLAVWPHEVALDDGRWWDGWRPFARAVRAGPFLVRPPWVDAEIPDGAIELVVDAGRSFGTGAHPSTTLALRALGGVVARGASVLDAGCGSGALAIGAALLGAAEVVAVDTDPEAVAAATANVAANAVGAIVEVSDAAVEGVVGAFDVVVANLGSPLVFDLAAPLTARCRPGGAIVLSGMLGDHAARLAVSYPDGELLGSTEEAGWTCAVLRHGPAAGQEVAAFTAKKDT